ncbi:DNA-invertase hin [Phycisphaerales bacterium]|nr:DNA-invertase hin [Phycisphaerales bacterium]
MRTSVETKPAKNVGVATVRCAIYTRKSSEQGLEQEFNSLHAQRESGEAYVASMKHEGWVALPDQYNDGGFTGGNTDRPGCQRLMADIEAGKVNCVVVYKVDRLSRSLMDFARMMSVFEKHRVSFVSVTQQFNTTQSMGRLTLNILLSFAQFEREIISERTRDKIAASKRKGKWFGGKPILGYDLAPQPAGGSKLVVNAAEAEVVREIYQLYLEHRSLTKVAQILNARGCTSKRWTTRKGTAVGGRVWDKHLLINLLTNPAYVGKIKHKKELFAGEHAAIIDEPLWQQVYGIIKHNGRTGGMHVRNQHGALLKGLIHCGPCGHAMGHSYSVKDGKAAYRYYVCYVAQKQGWHACPSGSLPAEQIERLVVDRIKHIGGDATLVAATFRQLQSGVRSRSAQIEKDHTASKREIQKIEGDIRKAAMTAGTDANAAARLADLHERLAAANEQARALRAERDQMQSESITQAEVAEALREFAATWDVLYPREQAAMLANLVKRVDYDGAKKTVSITLHPAGLRTLGQSPAEDEEAA